VDAACVLLLTHTPLPQICCRTVLYNRFSATVLVLAKVWLGGSQQTPITIFDPSAFGKF
jgi:hypothetical protein